ncbi:hypothetical protein ACPUEX_22400 [Enterobacter vonholyi]
MNDEKNVISRTGEIVKGIVEIGTGKYTEKGPEFKPLINDDGSKASLLKRTGHRTKHIISAKIPEWFGVYNIKNSAMHVGKDINQLSVITKNFASLISRENKKDKYYSSYEVERMKYKRDESFIKNQYTSCCYASLLSFIAFLGMILLTAYTFHDGYLSLALKCVVMILSLSSYASYTTLAYMHNMRDKFEIEPSKKLECFKSFDTAFPLPSEFKTDEEVKKIKRNAVLLLKKEYKRLRRTKRYSD